MYAAISFVNSLTGLIWSLTVLVIATVIFIAECYAVYTLFAVTREENKNIFKSPLKRWIEKNEN